MGLPGKRDDPMRAGMTAIVFMKISYDWLMVEYKKLQLKQCADYPVFPLFWAILIAKFNASVVLQHALWKR
jgi:hypothetical protein